MLWEVSYCGYCDYFIANNSEEALEKARILAAGANTFSFRVIG